MNKFQQLGLVVLASSSLMACVSLSDGKSIVKTEDGVLVSMTNNLTLYTFDKDSSGKSSCYEECADNWPPLLVDANASSYGSYSLVKREDGKMQFAYKGKPLYYFLKDKKPGEQKGEGLGNGAWHVVKM